MTPTLLLHAAVLQAQLTLPPPTKLSNFSCYQAYTAEQYATAAACYSKAAAVAGSSEASAAALLMEARSYLHQNDAVKAETVLRACLQADPRGADALYLLGDLLQRRNAPKESLEMYTRAAAVRNPTGGELRIVAFDYALLGSYVDARHWLEQAVALSPGDAEAWYDLGRVRMQERLFAEGAKALQQSLFLRPNSAKAEDNLGICLEAENQPDAAGDAYARAVKLMDADTHSSEQPLVDYGAFLNTRNRFSDALALLQRATRSNSTNSRAFAELSRAYSGLGNSNAALPAMARAVALDVNNSRLHFQLGRLYRAAGMVEQAKREFDLSAKLYGQKSAE